MCEPGSHDVRAIVARDVTAPVEVAQLASRVIHPPAVVPRTSDKKVEVLRVGLFEFGVNSRRANEVFLVVPASNVEVGYARMLQIRGYGMLLPKIVVWMLDKVVPRG